MLTPIQLPLPRKSDSRSLIDIIRAVNQPLGFFTLAIVIALAVFYKANGNIVLQICMVGLIALLVVVVAYMAVCHREGLYKPPKASVTAAPPPVQLVDKPKTLTVSTERPTLSGERPPIAGEDQSPPAADVWYSDIRPVLHHAIQYTVPTYYLDKNLMMVDWNIAFDLIFSRLGSKLRGGHVIYFINELLNFDEVMEHAQEFTREVKGGRIPFIDMEPIRYASERYGEVSFLKVAVQLHGPEGQPRGWSVSLMIKEIDWAAFKRDLLEETRKDKLWGVYSASYDRVLLEFEPYKQLIRDVIGVVPPGRQSVVDLGAGTGNTTKELLGAKYAVTAVENNLGMLDRLRSKRMEGRLTVVKSSIEQPTTLKDKAFDAAVMVNVLYAVDDPFACLQAVHRILKPNGVLGLSTTHSKSDLELLLNSIRAQLENAGRFDELKNDYKRLYDVNRQIERDIARRHSRDEYREWIRKAGFKIIKDVSDTYENAVMLIWAQKN